MIDATYSRPRNWPASYQHLGACESYFGDHAVCHVGMKLELYTEIEKQTRSLVRADQWAFARINSLLEFELLSIQQTLMQFDEVRLASPVELAIARGEVTLAEAVDALMVQLASLASPASL